MAGELRPEGRAEAALVEANVAAEPMQQFRRWFDEALTADVIQPETMILATVDDTGPDARAVLLKGFDRQGFVFYTNLRSAKAGQLAGTPKAAAVFTWLALHRQVRVRGQVSRLSLAESDDYFATRSRPAQLGAWASRQSQVLGGRRELEQAVAQMADRFAHRPVPRPEFWGGYRLCPDTVEFWQGRSHRLHDRLRYRRQADGWLLERLFP